MTQSVFTSLNTSIFVNDAVLNGVFQVSVFERLDDSKNSTYIKVKRHVIGNDYLVNTMRGNKFSFRLINNMSSGGYVTEIAELDQFEMELGVETDGSEMLLEQTLVIKTLTFFFQEDARSPAMKTTETDDVKNLINIIKENQAKTQVNRAVLPNTDVDVKDEELVWLNAKDPEQLKDVKPRKLKKNKTKRA